MCNKTFSRISVAAIASIALLGTFSAPAHAARVKNWSIANPENGNSIIMDVESEILVVNEYFLDFDSIEKTLDVENNNNPGIQSFNITATNKTTSAWDSFVFNLDGSRASFFDTTTFVLPISDKFNIASFTGVRTLTFSNGIVSPDETVNFQFALNIPDRKSLEYRFGIQEQPFAKPVPTPALLPGLFALGAGALRKRKQQTASAIA
jgi:hypothetical protein